MNQSRRGGCALLAALLTLALVRKLGAQAVSFHTVEPAVLLDHLKRAPATNKERGQTLGELFKESGCTQLTEQSAKGLATPNVICTLPGTETGMIVVGAHYDKVVRGRWR